MMEFMTTVHTGPLAVPRNVPDRIGVVPGDQVNVAVDDGRLIIEPAREELLPDDGSGRIFYSTEEFFAALRSMPHAEEK